MSDSLPLIWTEGETPPAAPAGYCAKGVSQNRLSAASHQDKNNFCCRVLMHGAMSLMSSWCHFCVRDGDGKGFSDNHTFDYLEAGPEGVGCFVSSAEVCSSPGCLSHISQPKLSAEPRALRKCAELSVSQRGQKAKPLYILSLLQQQQQQLAAAASSSLTTELHLIIPLSAAFSSF